ncbi:VOC family protein [Thalassospira sp.]|uniref:VOC family protein n=1 Tax=Thalassospira sp. TaxID=1912094 RepID=UPI001B0D639C|nr:VOC family protein [Thalassospira sp.]MBO6807964.1 VOC family protein [Thalassospira sp.]MBO6842516.1 VOC family protein [Thalassospira sp.]
MFYLEHVNLVVKDINATLDFIQTAFPDWKVRGEGEGDWYGQKRKWLHVGTDGQYITLNSGDDAPNRDLTSNNPGLAHLGFSVDDVDGITRRLTEKGYVIGTIGADHPHRKTIYFTDPAGFEFEFIEYFSDDVSERNMYGGETSGIVRVGTALKEDRKMTGETFVRDLYRNAVDQKDVTELGRHLADDVRFRIGNHAPVIGKDNVLSANQSFFDSIASMSHQIDAVYTDGNATICDGSVHYVRLDGSEHSAVFSTTLVFRDNLIADYLVFADISKL